MGSLPAGVVFKDNGNGTATLSGVPTSAGSFPLTLTAGNGQSPDATQFFTLTVQSAANLHQFSGDLHGRLARHLHHRHRPGTVPATVLTESAHAQRREFKDNGDGTATLTGTPLPSASGIYPITLTATGGGVSTTQTFNLTINSTPVFTSAAATTLRHESVRQLLGDHDRLADCEHQRNRGAACRRYADRQRRRHGDSGGSPTVAGVYQFTLTASNGVGGVVNQVFTLTVGQPPVFTSANATTFTVGQPASSRSRPRRYTTQMGEVGLRRALPSWTTGTGPPPSAAPKAGSGQIYLFTLSAKAPRPPCSPSRSRSTRHRPSPPPTRRCSRWGRPPISL